MIQNSSTPDVCYRLDIKVAVCLLVFAAVSKTHLVICSLICAILHYQAVSCIGVIWNGQPKWESKTKMLFKSKAFGCIFGCGSLGKGTESRTASVWPQLLLWNENDRCNYGRNWPECVDMSTNIRAHNWSLLSIMQLALLVMSYPQISLLVIN